MSVKVDVAANVQSTVQGIGEVTRAFDGLRQRVKELNGDLSKLSSDDRDRWKAAERHAQQTLQAPMAIGMRNRLESATGVPNPTLHQILNARLHQDPVQDEKRKRDLLNLFGLATSGQPNTPAGPSWGRLGGAVGGVIAGGGGMGSIGGGVGGYLGGAFGPIGAFVGSAVGSIAGGAVGDAFGGEDRRLLALDGFMRRVGEAASGFDVLNDAMKGAADRTDVTFADLQQRAQIFANLSGLRGSAGAISGAETSTALARGFGIDADVATEQLARMQGGNQSSDAARRNAILVGETIARVGFAKPAEVMEKLGAHVERFVDRTLETPNLSAFAELLIAANKTGSPGLVGGGAAGILNQVDAAIASGGGAGEAGKVFQLRALLSANPDMRTKVFIPHLLGQAGAFASADSMGIGNGTTTNFEAVMRNLEAQFGSSRFDENGRMKVDERGALKLDAVSNLFGLGSGWKAKGLLEMHNQLGSSRLGAVETALKAAGLTVGDVNLSGLRELTTFASTADLGKPSDLDEIRSLARSNRDPTSTSAMADTQAQMLRYAAESAGHLLEIRNSLVTNYGPKVLDNFNEALGGIPGELINSFGRARGIPAGNNPGASGRW